MDDILLHMSEATDSSGSEYEMEKDDEATSESSSASDINSKRSRKRIISGTYMTTKKTRFSTPQAWSTPRTQDAYDFSDGDAAEYSPNVIRKRTILAQSILMSTPTTTNINVCEKILARVISMEGKLLSAMSDLKEQIKRKDQQIEALTQRVEDLEGEPSAPKSAANKKQMKSSNHVRAAIRAALQHAENEKDLKLDISYPLKSEKNNPVTQYARKFAKTYVPDMDKEDFNRGMKRIFISHREKASREKTNKADAHKEKTRKLSRKITKSRNRVSGIKKSEIPPLLKEKYVAVLNDPHLMSSEESNVDEEGEKIFKVRRKIWESREFRKAKKIGDKGYEKQKCTKLALSRIRRIHNDPSRVPPPVNFRKEDSWIVDNDIVDYGVI